MAKKEKTSKESIEHLATLAKLSLTDDEVKEYSDQIASILDYVDKVQDLDVDGEFRSQTDLRTVLREDEFEDSLSQKEATSGRKTTSEEGFFTITTVIKK